MDKTEPRRENESKRRTERAWLVGILMIGLTIILTAVIIQAPEIIAAIDRFTQEDTTCGP
jgi:hypothetical protein